jgi:DNA replication and repair protein RecF
VHVKQIQLNGFRNLAQQQIDLSPGINIFVGDNGQGKTNILEAVHVLSCLRSFRPARLNELINHQQSQALISSTLESGGIPIQMRIIIDEKGRRLWMGERAVRNVADYLGRLNLVAFTPDDLSMVKGAPSVRRRFLDRSAFLFWPEHLVRVREFSTALRARNRLLQSPEKPDAVVLQSFTQTLAKTGTIVSRNRLRVVKMLTEPLMEILGELLDGVGPIELRYKPGWDLDGELDQQLTKRLQKDLLRGSTGIGPQLDDFDLEMNAVSARKFASQGQQRALAVALLLSVVGQVVSGGSEQPVILLDDVSSELDSERRITLFERVRELGGQVLLTTTDERLVSELLTGPAAAEAQRFSVCQGVVSRLEAGGDA